MIQPKYVVGIDLGTTHCVLAYAPVPQSRWDEPQIRIFPVPQLTAPGEVASQPLLPSFLFLPGPHDVPEGGLALPWNEGLDYAVGDFARKRGAEIPNRLVSSAKSWLCHSGVDRLKPILPWDSPAEARRVSPLEATACYLRHLRDAWNHTHAKEDDSARLEIQEIFLTVPASFDAVARELTVKAAEAAGLERLTLLEEPQAAFYAWIESQGDRWRKNVWVGDCVLVCDLGGGTTDFSLIRVEEEHGEMVLRRVAVGDHILLGGDNMDLTLAYALQAKLSERGVRLDGWQFRGLWHACRTAKERLLTDPNRETEPIVVLGRGSSLIGGTLRTELTREEVTRILLEGFFPLCGPDDFPQSRPKVGFREMGLPYESDPAVTRHLARFLSRQGSGEEPGEACPTGVLFNGGVMKPEIVRERVVTLLSRWRGGEPLRRLESPDLDLAVARGAAAYGLARHGHGVRIRAGAPRSFYIGIESAMPTVPGVPTPIKALCVVPFGMEEGTREVIREKEFGLVVGEDAVFPLLASGSRKDDRPGDVVEDWSGEIDEVVSMETHLPISAEDAGGTVIPVWLESAFTEVGTLEIWCVSREDERRWKLEFNLRESES
ncbi:MAG: Hsp70 family protein [Thermodesulfobacteriota bacterium]|nr:Hsp70 family protein [Thermodesulfobacteriota bacterium]